MAVAHTRAQEGLTDISEFIYDHTPKAITDLIEKAWNMHRAAETLSHENKTRMEILREKLNGDCSDKCTNKVWFNCAMEVLQKNGIHPYVYAYAVRELLSLGR